MKKIIFIFLIIIGVIFAYNYFTQDNNLYVMIPSHGIKEKVPEDIVKSRDCDKYMKWHSSQAWAIYAPYGIKCPWREPYGEYGYFEVNGVKLKVPRKDLDGRFSTDIPDGKVHDLWFRYVYPDMIAASEIDTHKMIDPKCANGPNTKAGNKDGKFLNYNLIEVRIMRGDGLPNACHEPGSAVEKLVEGAAKGEGICENYQSCKRKVYCDTVQGEYAREIWAWDERQRARYKPTLEPHGKEFGLDAYRLLHYSHEKKEMRYSGTASYLLGGPFIYLKGNPYEPKEWFVCSEPGEPVCEATSQGYCTTKFYLPGLGKKLMVKLEFSSNVFLPKNQEIKNLAIKKMQSYIIK